MIKNIPKVSVGMPVYNAAQWIESSIDSILGQSFSDFELIISDNASTDDTEAICKTYAARDERVRYYRNAENVGASDNYNAVFHYARGEYFKWASSNDICGRDFLSKCVKVLDKHPDVALCSPKTRLFSDALENAEDYEDNLNLPDETACERFVRLKENMRLNNVMNGLIRSKVLSRTPLIKTYYSSDVILMAEVAMHGKFVELTEHLFYRRMDPETATRMKDDVEVLRHYDPNLKNLMLFQTWKIYYGYFAATIRAPIDFRDRLCLFKQLTKRFIWDRNELTNDLIEAIKAIPHFLRRQTQSSVN